MAGRFRQNDRRIGEQTVDELRLMEPTIEYEEQIFSYRKEFLKNGDSMDGTSNLRKYQNVKEWIRGVILAKSKETCAADRVPGTQYLCVRINDNRLVGMIDIRSELNDFCYKYAGHIGYSIRKTERNKGYAGKQLELAIEICRQQALERILITCAKENIASARTIIKNGGVLENEIFDPNDNTITQRYWVDVK